MSYWSSRFRGLPLVVNDAASQNNLEFSARELATYALKIEGYGNVTRPQLPI